MAAMSADCRFESTGPAPDGDAFSGTSAVREVWARFFQDIQTRSLSQKRSSPRATGVSSAGGMIGAAATCVGSTCFACATDW